jgi:CheY-like chemotaxis protein
MSPTHAVDAIAERERLNLLHSYAVLDTPPEEAYDRIAQEAARLVGAPCAAITFVTEDRCWFKARVGLEATQLPRGFSICGYAFRSSGVFVVPDAANDERFRQLPLVADQGFRFYAGVPLITPGGHSLGTLCVLDTKPLSPSPGRLDALRVLGARLMMLLESRLRDLAPAPSVSFSARAEPRTPPPARPPAPVERDLVLVVDDEEMIRGVTAAMVNRLGCETRLAADGQEALDRIAALGARVRLVLTDINMPVLNGVEMIRALRAQARSPTVVAMSGKFTPDIRRELADLGVAHFIPKPFGMAEIAVALKAAAVGPP